MAQQTTLKPTSRSRMAIVIWLSVEEASIAFVCLCCFRIERLWTNAAGEKFAFGHHYLRPHETFHEPSRKFFVNEVKNMLPHLNNFINSIIPKIINEQNDMHCCLSHGSTAEEPHWFLYFLSEKGRIGSGVELKFWASLSSLGLPLLRKAAVKPVVSLF